MTNFKRRQILNAMLSAGAVTTVGGVTSVFPGAVRAATPGFTDYKALVVLFLHGGNDAYNMIVPLGDEEGAEPVTAGTGYKTYRESRGDIAVTNLDLVDHSPGANAYAAATDAEAYLKGVYPFANMGVGINGVMPELAQLVADKKAAVVANIGTLVEPVSKSTLNERRLPPFLFAHNHQQRAMETGWADNLNAAGWAGRLADLWEAHTAGGVNDGSPLGLNVSYGGATRMMVGSRNSPTVLSPGVERLFNAGSYDSDTFKAVNETLPGDDPLYRLLKVANYRAATLSDLLSDHIEESDDFSALLDPYGNALFANPSAEQLALSRGLSGHTLRALHSAARMVNVSANTLGLKRQILFVDMGGFDNHSDLATQHPLLLRELSLALWDFQVAMDAIGLGEQVAVCTLSDFGRTLGNNGDGTDHAWAGHNLVVGGAVNGGTMIGAIPDMTLGGSNDTGSHPEYSKGRMIPAIAVDQYLATLLSWFGVADEDMVGDGEQPGLFPNLANFKPGAADPIASAYLRGLMKTAGEEPEPGGSILDPLLDLLRT